MRRNADIFIQGTGSRITAENAQKISQIWESWMPSHFNAVNVTFSDICSPERFKLNSKNLCFYSGGVDSTYSILGRCKNNLEQDLLTVHGMDYRYGDDDRFDKLVEKTNPFREKCSNELIFVKTNIYDIYNKYDVNTKVTHVGHIFSLSGSAFLFSEHYSNISIAADYRLDQQFQVHPWGSNSATNMLFNDGTSFLLTDDDNVTRSEKMTSLLDSKEFLSTLSFCVDYNFRPNNCGLCSKCMRTKLMFFASTGIVPDIFKSLEINSDAIESIDLTKKSERAFFLDLYGCAKKNGRLDEMPYLKVAFETLKKIDGYSPFQIYLNHCKKRVRKNLKFPKFLQRN